MIIETPKGLKMALLRSYLVIDEECFESLSKPAQVKKAHFGLYVFHGLIQKRQSFGPVVGTWLMAPRNRTVTFPIRRTVRALCDYLAKDASMPEDRGTSSTVASLWKRCSRCVCLSGTNGMDLEQKEWWQ